MFERFSDEARRTVVLAQEHAKILRNMEIAPGHVLLALLTDIDGMAARMLSQIGVNVGEAANLVRADLGRGELPPTGRIPFTAATRAVMLRADEEAARYGTPWVQPDHLLLAIFEEDHSTVQLLLGLIAPSVLNLDAQPRA